ncbi:N-6 DNA methylase, partial [Metasolibacillus meyeri]|uniref:N-6 DNA methylase n=1 Tax=Metasolibacillus meyeri TaxID=1071052 RepID=UPI001290388E
KCIDPAMGSGHILLYMFDLLYEIYKENGYPERSIPQLILENNIYGLEIDERAFQMANFTILMKACQYNKRFLKNLQTKTITLNLINIYETNDIDEQELK